VGEVVDRIVEDMGSASIACFTASIRIKPRAMDGAMLNTG
jgi:hypothetical protein